jgi:purine-binding chemotaxis protein CheW
VVEALKAGVKKQVGVIVDSVSEVQDISEESMEGPPEFGGEVDRSLITGLAKIGKKIVILLNIDRILFEEAVEEAAGVI